jgi:hypothetical protein
MLTVAPLVNLMKQQCSTCNNAESLRRSQSIKFSNAVIESIKIPELKQRITKLSPAISEKGFDL